VLQVAYCRDVVEVVVCGQYGRVVRDGVPGDEDLASPLRGRGRSSTGRSGCRARVTRRVRARAGSRGCRPDHRDGAGRSRLPDLLPPGPSRPDRRDPEVAARTPSGVALVLPSPTPLLRPGPPRPETPLSHTAPLIAGATRPVDSPSRGFRAGEAVAANANPRLGGRLSCVRGVPAARASPPCAGPLGG
jgi:hypothetical protein